MYFCVRLWLLTKTGSTVATLAAMNEWMQWSTAVRLANSSSWKKRNNQKDVSRLHLKIKLALNWFWSSKRQNNCSHISRWTLTGLKQLSFTWFSINHVLEKSVRLKSDHQDPLRNVYFFISQLSLDCIALYVWIISISSY